MFAEQLRRAVEASPRVELAKVASLLWKAFAAGQVSEAEAQALSNLIEARRDLPALQKPTQRRLGFFSKSYGHHGKPPPVPPLRLPDPSDLHSLHNLLYLYSR